MIWGYPYLRKIPFSLLEWFFGRRPHFKAAMSVTWRLHEFSGRTSLTSLTFNYYKAMKTARFTMIYRTHRTLAWIVRLCCQLLPANLEPSFLKGGQVVNVWHAESEWLSCLLPKKSFHFTSQRTVGHFCQTPEFFQMIRSGKANHPVILWPCSPRKQQSHDGAGSSLRSPLFWGLRLCTGQVSLSLGMHLVHMGLSLNGSAPKMRKMTYFNGCFGGTRISGNLHI